MARYQYRLSGYHDTISCSGNALIAVLNPPGSGRKIVLSSIEIRSPRVATSLSATIPQQLGIARATLVDGTGLAMPGTLLDTSDTWPSGVVVRRNPAFSGSAPAPMFRVSVPWYRAEVLAAASQLYDQFAVLSPKPEAGVERITLREGESLVFYNTTLFTADNYAFALRVGLSVALSNGSVKVFHFYTQNPGYNQVVFSVENQAGSGVTAKVTNFSVQAVGSTGFTPYYRLAPLGRIDAETQSDPLRDITSRLVKLDTAHPDPTFKVFYDAIVYPYGMPENASADTGSASPKGFNYLKTKDFDGPNFRTLFTEQMLFDGNLTIRAPSDRLALRGRDNLGTNRSRITIREGEAIGIVMSAETANLVSATGMAGALFDYVEMTVSSEPANDPSIRLTGLKNPTEVRVFNAGTETEIAGEENVTSGTFEAPYDPDVSSSVDIAVLSLGYQNIRFTNVALGGADVTIPVQQVIDRQYLNP